MEVFKVNGITIDKDTFMSKIVDILDNVRFATIEQLSILLKAKQSDIHNVLLDVVVWYVKNHPGITYTKLCIDLSVRSEYVDELISDGRIFDKNAILKEKADLLKIEKAAEEVTNKYVRDVQRREAIRGLSSSIATTNTDVPQKRMINKFHTKPEDYKNIKW